MNLIKKLLILGCAIILLFSVAGCTKKQEPDVSAKELADMVKEQITKDYDLPKGENFAWDEVELTKSEGSDLLELMELDAGGIEDAVYLNDPMMTSANRIVIAKAKTDQDIEKIASGFKKLKESHQAEWEQYLPDQLEQVKHAVIETNGKFVMYIVYHDPSVIKKIIDDKLLEK